MPVCSETRCTKHREALAAYDTFKCQCNVLIFDSKLCISSTIILIFFSTWERLVVQVKKLLHLMEESVEKKSGEKRGTRKHVFIPTSCSDVSISTVLLWNDDLSLFEYDISTFHLQATISSKLTLAMCAVTVLYMLRSKEYNS